VYRYLLKPLLFLLPPERAHQFTLFLLRIVLGIPIINDVFRNLYSINHPDLQRTVMGLTFPNPVGLAAGFDKDGKHFRHMASLGFGFIEIGTVTPKPQFGNPRPRLFRLRPDKALINRLGFNNQGLEALEKRLVRRKDRDIIIGGNISKNKGTPNESAVNDYRIAFERLFPHVDYFVVNVSSPNTPDLRALQDKEPLTRLLSALQQLNAQKDTPKPILLKIAPDLTDAQIDDILDIVKETNMAGIIATNTTIERTKLQTSPRVVKKIGAGGLSGPPLRERSTEVIRYIHKKTEGKLTIIGVGGINSPEDAFEKLEAGASLVQLYTGLVYEGPTLVRKINQQLLN